MIENLIDNRTKTITTIRQSIYVKSEKVIYLLRKFTASFTIYK